MIAPELLVISEARAATRQHGSGAASALPFPRRT
jgi:hypothetical protein